VKAKCTKEEDTDNFNPQPSQPQFRDMWDTSDEALMMTGMTAMLYPSA
jgi:hypothetical protein